MRTTAVTAVALATGLLLAGCSSDGEDAATDETTTEETAAGDASIAFTGVEDGATVASPVAVGFEATNFEIVPAGEGEEGTGHMHVMIDVGCVAVGEEIPSDDSHVHFGDGSTSADLELEPGEHTLCLQAGDANHVALDVTDEITVTVE